MSDSLYCWSKIPTELLRRILSECELSDWKDARDALCQCQLVCKSWSTTAQIELYRFVYLPAANIGRFVSTLVHYNPNLCENVKNIQFRPVSTVQQQYDDTPSEEVFQNLDIILQLCPNIERICSTKIDERKFIMKHLGTTRKLRNLMLFPFPRDRYMQAVSRTHYAVLALNHEHSLTELSLAAGSGEEVFKRLMQRMPHFEKLKRLQLYGSPQLPFSIGDLDYIINILNSVTRDLELVLHDLPISPNHEQRTAFNYNITKLQISSFELSACAITYLEKQLVGLKALVVTTRGSISPKSQTEKEKTEWWKSMTALCQRLDYFNIDIAGNSEFLPNLERWINVMNASASHKQQQNVDAIEFTMNLSFSDASKKLHVIQMKKNGSCIKLFRFNNNDFSMDIDEVLERVQFLSPNIIRLLDVNPASRNEIVFSEQDRIQDKSLRIFNHAISATSKQPAPVIHLDRITLLAPSSTLHVEQPRIRVLKFTNSIFHPTALRDISSQLPEIEILSFEDCFVQSDSHAQFFVNIPQTKLGHLKLGLSHIDRERPVGSLKIHLSTATEEKTFRRILEDTDNGTHQEAGATIARDKHEFYISIFCKELKSWDVFGIKVGRNQQWRDSELNGLH
ncbi:hypothetical protein [Parasitella parasitica]|uniref:F-box domain-containing protein n=1 Tax=Parasitella parasitica TaxID=35722 RepID=A0A0B7N3N4_9FUNG|nr:hypothetical protein [Parasitella parasitica]